MKTVAVTDYPQQRYSIVYLRSLSSSLQLDFWWGLSALSACMEHHVSLVHVLHPSFASGSPRRHTQLSENLQMHSQTLKKNKKLIMNLKVWKNCAFWDMLINKWGVIAYQLCISFCICSSFQKWHRLFPIVMQSQSHKIIFNLHSSQRRCVKDVLTINIPYLELRVSFDEKSKVANQSRLGQRLVQCSLSLPLKEMLQITEDEDWNKILNL